MIALGKVESEIEYIMKQSGEAQLLKIHSKAKGASPSSSKDSGMNMQGSQASAESRQNTRRSRRPKKELIVGIENGRKSTNEPTPPLFNKKWREDTCQTFKKTMNRAELMRRTKNYFQKSRANNPVLRDVKGQGKRAQIYIHPYSTFRKQWNTFMVVLTVLHSVSFPIIVSYLRLTEWNIANCYLLGVVYLLDTITNSLTGCQYGDTIHLDIKVIFLDWLKKTAWIDVLSTASFLLALPNIMRYDQSALEGLGLHVIYMVRGLTTLSSKKHECTSLPRLEVTVKVNDNIAAFVSMFLRVLIFCHWNACLFEPFTEADHYAKDTWYMASGIYKSPTFTRYTQSMFSMIAEMTTCK
jgi:hypothetical protein